MRPARTAAALLGWAVLSLVVVVANSPGGGAARPAQPLVLTREGRLLGVRTSFEGRPLHAFYGVPYARPPLGRLRFLPPVPVTPWRHVWSARRFKGPCMQRLDEVHYPVHLKMLQNASEDCLYLNVWTAVPDQQKVTSGAVLKPVVVILHGGVFSFGNTGSLLYDGSALAALGNVTVVSMNFRLGVFGFLDAMNREAPGNVGLLDQRMALQWVRRNIQSFGGHPEKVTLLGLSSGAASGGLHMTAPQSRGLFHAAILEGGGPLCDAFVEPSRRSLERANHLAGLLSCSRMGAKLEKLPRQVLACLRSRPAEDLLWAQERVASSSLSSFVATYGNSFLPKSPWKSKYLPVPLLIGTSSNEGSPFVGRRCFEQPPRLNNRSEALKMVGGLLETYNIPLPSGRPPMEPYLEIASSKGGAPQQGEDLRRLVADIFGDAALHCPCRLFAEWHAKGGQPVFVYKFCYATSSLHVPEWMGVPHSSTFWYMSGVPLRMPERFHEVDRALSREMVRVVARFAAERVPGDFMGQPWAPMSSGSSLAMHLHPHEAGVRKDERSSYCQYWNSRYL
ncbi:acetylcholinesterase-like isoform X2 [Dermacentor albipictus]|uniref:acetylcholinesterase-like isoform X2 n=1 Tax=Dermacentor albipictus TaxID=60249 RepID=UPI0031FCA383